MKCLILLGHFGVDGMCREIALHVFAATTGISEAIRRGLPRKRAARDIGADRCVQSGQMELIG